MEPFAAGPRPLLAVDARPAAVRDALVAACEGGPALLPLDPRLPAAARGRLLAALRPTGALRDDGVVGLPGGVGVPDDVVAVVATSGSTDTPRGVLLTRAALEAAVRLGLERTGADPAVPWLCCLPTSHVAGLLVLLRGLLTGTPARLHDGFDAARAAAEPGPVHLAVVPTMLRRLLDAAADPARWATVLVGGAAPPADLQARVPHATVTYGMTETAGGCVYDGRPLDGVEVAIAGDGRIRLRGPTLANVYRDGPLVDGDGWFTTGDLGRLDPDGRLEVLGRADDMVVTGGEKVLAGAVARALEAHPGVRAAVALGVPDPEWGQAVVAAAVASDPAAPPSLAVLRDHVAARLTPYAAPQRIVWFDALPLLPGGKVDRLGVAARVRRALCG